MKLKTLVKLILRILWHTLYGVIIFDFLFSANLNNFWLAVFVVAITCSYFAQISGLIDEHKKIKDK